MAKTKVVAPTKTGSQAETTIAAARGQVQPQGFPDTTAEQAAPAGKQALRAVPDAKEASLQEEFSALFGDDIAAGGAERVLLAQAPGESLGGAGQAGAGGAAGGTGGVVGAGMTGGQIAALAGVGLGAAGLVAAQRGREEDVAPVAAADTTAPTVTITDDVAAATTNGPVTFTFTFSEAVTGFTATDVVVTGGATGAFTAVSATVYTLVVTPTANSVGNITVNVAAGVAVDAAGNPNTIATQSVQAVDTVVPTVAITDDEAGTAIVAGGDVVYTFTFSEGVTGFDATDVAVTGGTKGAFTAVSATVYTLAVTPNANSTANITVDVAAGVALDAAGNPNTIATQSVQAVDTVVPTVAITDDEAGTAIVAGGDVVYTFTFSQGVIGFDAADVVVTGGAKGAFSAVSPTVYTLAVTPNANSTANITVNVAAGVAVNASGNNNTAAVQSVQAVDTDPTPPTVMITDDEGGAANIAGGDVVYTFTFSKGVTGFDATDVAVTGGAKGAFSAVSATVYTLAVTPNANSTANITVDVAAGVALDAPGNPNTIATQSVQAVNTVVPTPPSTPDLVPASDLGSSNTDNLTKVTTPTLTGTAVAGATVTLFDTDGTTVLGTNVADVGGAWTIISSALAAGVHTLTAKQTNVGGNVSAASGALAVTVDTTLPVPLAACRTQHRQANK